MKMQLASLVQVFKDGEPNPLQMLIHDDNDVESILDELGLEDDETTLIKQIAYVEIVNE